MRRAASAVALVEQHDAINAWIEQPAMPRRTSRAGATVQNDGWLAVRIAAGFPVHAVAIANLEHAAVVRFDRWIQVRHSVFQIQIGGDAGGFAKRVRAT
jgi:hypothetical protein